MRPFQLMAQRRATSLLCRGLVVVRLFEEEVGGELFVLVAGEVSLDSLIALETQTAQLQGFVSA